MDQLHCFVRLDEEFQFHLLELAGAEGEVLGRDLVAEGLADLADPEGNLHARGVADILELGEDRLGRLGSQVGDVILRRRGADIGAEHEVEGTRLVEQSPRLRVEINGALDDLGPFLAKQFDLLGFARRCAGVLGNQETHTLAEALDVLSLFHQHREGAIEAPSVGSLGSREADHRTSLRLDMVGADPFVGDRALAHHVGEGVDVAAGLPDRRMHDDGGIQTDDILPVAGHGTPPGVAEIPLQFCSERAVVPESPDSSVDLRGLVDEAPAFAETDDLLHAGVGGGWFGHKGKGVRLKTFRLLGQKQSGWEMIQRLTA